MSAFNLALVGATVALWPDLWAALFTTGMEEVPGRMNVFSLNGGTVILDYGHNAAALRAMTAAPTERSEMK